jgi:outer membrane receptor protein involved in Fe transport
MRNATLCASALVAVMCGITTPAFAQLEEIVVTATRRETNLQDTPVSIQAFTSAQLELGGITNGRDLGIMVPNVVLNPNTGGAQSNFYVRGLPGVGLYVDGVWQDGFGFQQMDFTEMERIEVLRGPQGTLFGRNTNGGAVNMTTKKPADEFGARVKLSIGDFDRRDAQVAVDLPITDKLKSRFTGATYQNDGFLKGLTTPWNFGAQDDTILRADFLWKPADTFSLRFTYNDEKKRGTDPRIHRMTRYDNSKIYAYNIMLGAYQAQAVAACQADLVRCAAIGAGAAGRPAGIPNYFNSAANTWAAPPSVGFGTRYTGVASPAFDPVTHTTDYQGGITSAFGDIVNGVYVPNPRMADIAFNGPGQVGKWETKSDSMENGITADLNYATVTADWDINDKLHFQAILANWDQYQRQVIDFDGTEFLITTDDLKQQRKNESVELHLTGQTKNGRINWIGGYYRLDQSLDFRNTRWGMWEFVVPNYGPSVPAINVATSEYVRQTATLLGLDGLTGGKMLTADTAPVAYGPTGRYPWNFGSIATDLLTNRWDKDHAFFGEATFSVTKKLDLTVGARVSSKTGGDKSYTPSDAFRTPDPAVPPQGDPFAFSAITLDHPDPSYPSNDTYKFSAAYHVRDSMMIYATYAEGFTSQSTPLTTIGPTALPPSGCGDRINATQVFCTLPAEIVENKEIGLRSDWLQGKLRFNATYFDSLWTGMRVNLLPKDAGGNTQPFPYQSGEGKGTASGWEFEVVWRATERLRVNFGLGLIDTNYIQAGVFDGTTGNYPGSPFAYAPDKSFTLGANYEIPLSSGAHILLVGDYGYMGPYARDAAYQRTLIDANGKPVLEPAYGILNARFVYEPANRKYSVELWGKNLTDELYVNGGFDTRDTWGYDFAIVGRSREIGVTLGFQF